MRKEKEALKFPDSDSFLVEIIKNFERNNGGMCRRTGEII